MGPDSQYS